MIFLIIFIPFCDKSHPGPVPNVNHRVIALPTGNNLAILAESAAHPLGEAQRISPHLPNAACQTHLIDPGNSPLISIKRRTRFSRIIMPYHAEVGRVLLKSLSPDYLVRKGGTEME